MHALPLEETSSIREPGRTATAGGHGWRPPSSGGGGGLGSSATAGTSVTAPLVVLDRWVGEEALNVESVAGLMTR